MMRLQVTKVWGKYYIRKKPFSCIFNSALLTDGGMDIQMDGQTVGWTNSWSDGWRDVRMVGWTDGPTDGLRDTQSYRDARTQESITKALQMQYGWADGRTDTTSRCISVYIELCQFTSNFISLHQILSVLMSICIWSGWDRVCCGSMPKIWSVCQLLSLYRILSVYIGFC